MVGGLVVSQLLTLYITPVFYTSMERFQGVTGRFRRNKTAAPAIVVPRSVVATRQSLADKSKAGVSAPRL